MEQIILGLGSNIGDRLAYLQNAVKSISRFTQNCKASYVYKTKPRDYFEQDDFLNIVVIADYEGSPQELLSQTQKIEVENGRDREHQILKGPRTIDIDILLFGNQVIKSENLIVPHPAIQMRQFVLIPLLELLPDSADPISKMPYRNFLEKLEDQGVEKYRKLF